MALTSSNFQQTMDDNPVVLVGFSSTLTAALRWAGKDGLPKLNELGVISRVNTDAERRLTMNTQSLKIFSTCNFVCGNSKPFKRRCLQYDGLHLAEDIVGFARRVRGQVAPRITSMPGVGAALLVRSLRPGGAAGATRKGEPDFSLPTLSAESVAIGFSLVDHFDRQGSEKGPGEANYDDDEEEERRRRARRVHGSGRKSFWNHENCNGAGVREP